MTKKFVIGATAIIALADVAFVISGDQTISEFLYIQSRHNPIIAVVAGILVGHIFWPVKESK